MSGNVCRPGQLNLRRTLSAPRLLWCEIGVGRFPNPPCLSTARSRLPLPSLSSLAKLLECSSSLLRIDLELCCRVFGDVAGLPSCCLCPSKLFRRWSHRWWIMALGSLHMLALLFAFWASHAQFFEALLYYLCAGT